MSSGTDIVVNDFDDFREMSQAKGPPLPSGYDIESLEQVLQSEVRFGDRSPDPSEMEFGSPNSIQRRKQSMWRKQQAADAKANEKRSK